MERITCGIDTIRISRIADVYNRKGEQFLNRVYTPSEQALCLGKGKNRGMSLAARFAAKEAVSKALGTGIGPEGIRFEQIEILADSSGRPLLRLHDRALRRFVEMGGISSDVSLSHDGDIATAMCVMLFKNPGPGGLRNEVPES